MHQAHHRMALSLSIFQLEACRQVCPRALSWDHYSSLSFLAIWILLFTVDCIVLLFNCSIF